MRIKLDEMHISQCIGIDNMSKSHYLSLPRIIGRLLFAEVDINTVIGRCEMMTHDAHSVQVAGGLTWFWIVNGEDIRPDNLPCGGLPHMTLRCGYNIFQAY